MADIAMLVAEEYEKRMKINKKVGYQEAETTPLLAPIHWLRQHNLWHETHIQIKLFEPKGEVGFAALDGLFSA